MVELLFVFIIFVTTYLDFLYPLIAFLSTASPVILGVVMGCVLYGVIR